MNDIEIITAVFILFSIVYGVWQAQFDTPKKLRGELPKLKDADIDYPGHMAYANKGGEYFHGCRMARFRSVGELNRFFEPGNAGHLKLVGEIQVGNDGSVYVIFTNKLTNAEMDDLDEWNRNQHEYFQQKKQARIIEKQVAEEEQVKAAAEEKRYAEVGRAYEKRVGKIRGMPPGPERKAAEHALNAGQIDE